jgi:TolB-like protein/tetratricopeptide (TPR) repeat protein
MSIVRFGHFEVDTRARELKKSGRRVRIGDQPLRLLNLLLERPGELVTREELQSALWSDGTSVDYETAINKAVSQLRTALGDSPSSPRLLETLAKRGYRFIGAVERSADIPPMRDRVRSVAVLPFENLTGDPSQQFVADGLSDALITALGTASGLRTVPRTSARTFQAMNRPLSDIARLLRADACVEGSVSRSGDTLRIAVRLIDAADERVMWQGRFDERPETLLAFPDALGRTLAAELGTKTTLSPVAKAQIAARPEALTGYLRARYLWNLRTARDVARSIDEFNRAIALDPDFALAHAGLADAYLILGIWGIRPAAETYGPALVAAERALELDPNLPEAHTCLGEVLKGYRWDWEGAEQRYRRALTLNPSYSLAYQWYAQLLACLGRDEEAILQIQRARQTDPLSPAVTTFVSRIYLMARDYDRAVAEGTRAVGLEPYSPLAYRSMGRALFFAGQSGAAIAAFEHAIQLAGNLPMWEANLCFACGRDGDEARAKAILSSLRERQGTGEFISPVDLAVCCVGIGDMDAALDYLERAYAERVMRVMTLRDPEFDALTGTARYKALLARLRLV